MTIQGSDEASHGLLCCLCLHAREGVAPEADTIINGQAVCYDHMGYVQGGNFTLALARVIEHDRAVARQAVNGGGLDDGDDPRLG